ncbi:MAG: type II toxin-antitoxin system RelE/ParE family toxin [Candidatus Beckwithbacteria bacterium]|nr:type II toxin-antitoxin system RelE/ParE family toxin [Patescibacteria group bacterium]
MPNKVVLLNRAEKFVNSCTKIQKNKIVRNLYYLQEFGLTNSNPSVKKLTGTPFWEVRILGKDSIRLFCLQSSRLTISIIHAFYKKKQKTPIREIKKALNRLNLTKLDK